MNVGETAATVDLAAAAKASLILDLSVISLLVDKGILTADEVVLRIEALHNRLSNAQEPGVMFLLDGILGELRAQPGSRA